MTQVQKTNPKKIQRSHVQLAAKRWDEDGGFMNFRQSLKFEVKVGRKWYPPKPIASIAHKLATGRALTTNEFSGAEHGTWHKMFEDLNFKIRKKESGKQPQATFEQAVSLSNRLSSKARMQKISETEISAPQKVSVTAMRFVRSPHVVAEALHRAKGYCGSCNHLGPSRANPKRGRILVVHHKLPLSKGGYDSLENVVALCPNCHAQVHDQLALAIDAD